MHTTSGRWRLGLALALTTALFWGLLPIALTITLGGMDAWTLTWFRFAAASAALGLFLAWRRRLPLRSPLTRRGWWLYVVALLGLVANYVSYLVSRAAQEAELGDQVEACPGLEQGMANRHDHGRAGL